ncbi:MAG: LLM class F420-dependent oxidoreductase [Chloroflexi bacterium]|nr:LLM class F420-dependent oxidoreductase [Chloroflexota bacterium]
MKFGVCLPHYGRPLDMEALARAARSAEALGYDSLWVTDHVIVPRELDIVYRDHMLDALAFLSFLAGVTRRVQIGTSVIILPYRHPAVVAKQVATADVLSGGRVIFGAGAGWMEGEFQALGVPFRERGARTNEALQAIIACWENQQPTVKGKHYSFQGLVASPQPAQKPHPPIWIGGLSQRAKERAVRFGQAWHPTGTAPDVLAKEWAQVQEIAQRQGRREPLALTMRCGLRWGEQPASLPRFALAGSASEVAGQIETLARIGVSHLALDVSGMDYPRLEAALADFAAQVRPQFLDKRSS